MDIRTAFPSKYLQAHDVAGCRGGTVRVQIKRITVEGMKTRQGQQEKKAVIYFERAKKGLVVNKTNGMLIGEALGWDTADWPGHTIELYVAEVEAFGEIMAAIRVRIPKSAPASTSKASRAKGKPELVRQTEPMQQDQLPENGGGDEESPEAFDEPEPGDLDADGNPF